MSLKIVSIVFAIVVGMSYAGVGQLRQFVIRQNILDIPNARSSHSVPTPRGGGALIVSLVLCGLLIYLIGFAGTDSRSVLAYICGGGLIACISWIDDVKTLSSKSRFLVHVIAAALLIMAVGYWDTVYIPYLGVVSLGSLGAIVTLLWIVGLTNAFNFMDGIDGIAGSQALIAGIGWSLVGIWVGMPLIALWGILIAASSLGFLLHNWPPAKIFMGDVGSAFLGYTFSAVPLFLYHLTDSPLVAQKAFWVGCLLLWPFVLDAFLTFARRLMRGENVLEAHREHLYQRLIILGSSHDSVTTLYAGLAITGIGLAYWWISAETYYLLVAAWLGLIISLLSYVSYREYKNQS